MAKWWMVGALVMTLVSVADAAEPGQPLTIDLELRTDARVAADLLEQSQNEVIRIFSDAGIAVRWTDTAPRFTVNIVPQVLGYARAGSPVMGVAIRGPGGSTVRVFLKQVQDFARVHRIDLTTMLAYVIAHEVGHLLLGTSHSPSGLMQAGWDTTLVHDAATGALTFTDAQAERIRASR
jgi:hypothetical protein